MFMVTREGFVAKINNKIAPLSKFLDELVNDQ